MQISFLARKNVLDGVISLKQNKQRHELYGVVSELCGVGALRRSSDVSVVRSVIDADHSSIDNITVVSDIDFCTM